MSLTFFLLLQVELVSQSPGLTMVDCNCALIHCSLQFHYPHCTPAPVDLASLSGFELVKQNRFVKIYECNKEKGLSKIFFGFVKNVKVFNTLSANITKWSNTPGADLCF